MRFTSFPASASVNPRSGSTVPNAAPVESSHDWVCNVRFVNPLVVPDTCHNVHERPAVQKSSVQSTVLAHVDPGSWSKNESTSAVEPLKARLPSTTIWSNRRLPGAPCDAVFPAISQTTVAPVV
jgi:hypothetical protein